MSNSTKKMVYVVTQNVKEGDQYELFFTYELERARIKMERELDFMRHCNKSDLERTTALYVAGYLVDAEPGYSAEKAFSVWSEDLNWYEPVYCEDASL